MAPLKVVFLFLWMFSGWTSWFFNYYISMHYNLYMHLPWDLWFLLNQWLDVFHWLLKFLGHFLFKYTASAPGSLSPLDDSNYRYLDLLTISRMSVRLVPCHPPSPPHTLLLLCASFWIFFSDLSSSFIYVNLPWKPFIEFQIWVIVFSV